MIKEHLKRMYYKIVENEMVEIFSKEYFKSKMYFPTDYIEKRRKCEVKKINEKIKIRILHDASIDWGAIKTICEACNEDDEIDLLVIVNTKKTSGQKPEGSRVPWIAINRYDIESDKPDIFVLSHVFVHGNPLLSVINKNSKLVIMASGALIRYGNGTKVFCRRLKQNLGKCRPDYYIYDRFMYNKMKDVPAMRQKIIEAGNAKYDGIYKGINNNYSMKDGNKLKGKKIVLWATDHGMEKVNDYFLFSEDISFDVYSKDIFDYFIMNKDIALIFRPHPTFLKELMIFGQLDDLKLNNFRNFCNKSENIIFDESESYDAAFANCDAILTDAHCGIICSALPTLKPVGVLYRSINIVDYEEELTKNYYKIYSQRDLRDFFDMILEENDYMYERRRQCMKECIKHFDGENGLRMKDLFKSLYKERGERAL